MSKSVMIEVDETTKSILELVESRMSKGVEQSFESFKSDNNRMVQAMSSQLHDYIRDIEKNIAKETTRLEEDMGDLTDTLEDNLNILVNSIKKDSEKQIDAVKEVLLAEKRELLSLVTRKIENIEELGKNLNKQITTIVETTSILHQSVQKESKEFKDSSNRIKIEVYEQLNEIKTKQNDHETRVQYVFETIEDKVGRCLDQIETKVLSRVEKELNNISSRVEEVEREIKWANQPFFKKWFRGRSNK